MLDRDRERTALLLLRDALDLEPGGRAEFLARHCAGDARLHARVLGLLAASADADGAVAQRVEAESSFDPLVGTLLGPFRVVERIGRGGMGVVYRGERNDADFTQTVALKLIRRGFDFDDVEARFLRERRILARLSHPNLARLIDGGVAADGRPWFALEFVRGDAITRWCDAHRLDVKARVRLFLEVCAAVQYAHSQLVVHRDLKPGNILVGEEGTARLLDFGIARLLGGDEEANATMTMAGARYALTPEYAAPEQFDGAAVGVGADVYALGVILHELVAGVGPYAIDRNDMVAAERVVRETLPESLATSIARTAPGDGLDAHAMATARLAARRMSEGAYRAAVRGDLGRIVGKALAKEPARRYATVEAFAGDLTRWIAGAPVQIEGHRVGYYLGKFIKRNRVAVVIASSLALALVATSVLALRSAWNERVQRDAAVAEAARISAVRDYTLLMFRAAGDRGSGATTSAREVLKHGAEQIFTQYQDTPADGQEIAVNLADLFLQLGDTEGASTLLERVLAWPGIEANPDVLARARYNLAQAEYSRGNAPRSRELLDSAQAWWAAQAPRHAPILEESRTTQAQLERAEGKVEQAISTLQATIAARRLVRGNEREEGVALNALVLALIDAGRYEDAVRTADEGLALFKRLGLDRQVLGLAVVNNRGNALVALGRDEAAIADFRHVVELRRTLYGPSTDLATAIGNLALTLSKRVAAEDAYEQRATFAEVTGLLEEAYAMSKAFGSDTGRSLFVIRTGLAQAYVRRGEVAKAVPLADEAVRIGTQNFGDKSVFAGVGYRARADVRIAQGRYQEARADIAAAKLAFASLGKGSEQPLASLSALLEGIDQLDTTK